MPVAARSAQVLPSGSVADGVSMEEHRRGSSAGSGRHVPRRGRGGALAREPELVAADVSPVWA